MRIVTDITSDNMGYCKRMTKKNGVELRHISGIKGNFAISDDREYIASAVLHESKLLTEIIHSNVKEIVDQNQLVFETLWKKAIPAEQRISEIEDGILPIQTYLINNNAESLTYAQNFVKNANTGFSNSTSIGYFKLLNHNKTLLQAYLNHLSKYREGKIKGGVQMGYSHRKQKRGYRINKKIS